MSKNKEERIADLKAMHRIIISCNDETYYWNWVSYGWIPDEPTEEDFEYVADNEEAWVETCDRFGRYISKAVNNGGFFFDKTGYWWKGKDE